MRMSNLNMLLMGIVLLFVALWFFGCKSLQKQDARYVPNPEETLAVIPPPAVNTAPVIVETTNITPPIGTIIYSDRYGSKYGKKYHAKKKQLKKIVTVKKHAKDVEIIYPPAKKEVTKEIKSRRRFVIPCFVMIVILIIFMWLIIKRKI